MTWIPFYIKTENSLLQSMIRISDLVSKASDRGFQALTITDHAMFGTMEFYQACLSHHMKPIIGLELSYETSKFVLYAKNYHGYQNLIHLSTIVSEKPLVIEQIKEYADDLICILPFASQNLGDLFQTIYDDLYYGYQNEEEFLAYGDLTETLYMRETVALTKEDTAYIPYLKAIQQGCLERDIPKEIYGYLRTVEEYQQLEHHPQLVQKIYDMIDIVIPKRQDLLPIFDTGELTSYEYLKQLAIQGLKERFGATAPKAYIERLKYELDVIHKMGFCDYFLVVWDYVNFAKKVGILVGPGRGSAAGSLVSYVLKITDVDPLPYNLLFERFLNPERVTMPDIDIDFLDNRREEVIQYCVSKYGFKRASGIITFGTLASKQAIRDVVRIMDLDVSVASNLSKMLSSQMTLKQNYDANSKLQTYLRSNPVFSKVYQIAMKIEGLKRHTSIHAAGVVISSVDLDEVVPLYYHNDMYLTGYTMNYLEDLGLLKMDFLGLKNLNIIDRILKDLNRDGIDLTFDTIPFQDKQAFDIFEQVNTIGIFQFESDGMMNFLRKFKPHNFEEIFACLALYRPGPMGNIDTYIRRKEGKEKADYFHPSLEPILKLTYGILIYQEQIMQVANVMASYSFAEADILRRAMSKKKEEVLLKEKEKFITRAVENGYTLDLSETIYDLILKFASYGFNKAHSVAYATVSYKMAYLKAHYPAYFIRGLLDLSIGSSSSSKEYIYEAKKNHITILKPDINFSEKTYKIEDGKIRFPLNNIRNVGQMATDVILEERQKKPFKDIYDFVARTSGKAINTKSLTSLIMAGCFDLFGMNKRTLLDNLDLILNYAEVIRYLDEDSTLKPELEYKEEYPRKVLMEQEMEVFGFYLSDHPVLEYRMRYQKPLSITQVGQYFDKNVDMIVQIDHIKSIDTKSGQRMGFLTGEDETATIDIVLFPRVYEKFAGQVGDIVLVSAHVEKRFDKLQLVVNRLQILENAV